MHIELKQNTKVTFDVTHLKVELIPPTGDTHTRCYYEYINRTGDGTDISPFVYTAVVSGNKDLPNATAALFMQPQPLSKADQLLLAKAIKSDFDVK